MKLSNEERLVNAREYLGLTTSDMARYLNTSVEQVEAWEDGSEIINTTDIVIVSKAYDLGLMGIIFYLENIKIHSTISYIKPGSSPNIS